MKNCTAKTIFILFFFLIAQMSYAQVPKRTIGRTTIPSKQQVAKPVNKDLEKAQANLANAKKTYFKKLTVGTPTQKEGQKTLTAVDDSFLETNEKKVTNIKSSKKNNTICATQKIDVHVRNRNFNEFQLDGSPDWLKPGIVMKAQDFLIGNGKIEDRYDRSPMVLQTDLKGANNTFIEVSNPKNRNNINQALQDLTLQSNQPVNSNMYFKFYEIHSLEELGIKVNGKYSNAFDAVGASVGLSYGSKKTSYYYVMEFNQNMFNININGIDANNIFRDYAIPTDDYIFISRVNYGRRGLIIFKSTKTLSKHNIKSAVTTNAILLNTSLRTAFNQLAQDSEVEMEVFFYGGTSATEINSIEKNLIERKPNVLDLIKNSSSDHLLAKPISYDIKNLDNQNVGLEYNMIQPNYETCIDMPIKVVKKDLKLKVTLLDLQCIVARDSDNRDDYGIQQYIVYKAQGKEKQFTSRSITVFPDRMDGPVWVPNQKNILISGDVNNQIRVKENRNRSERGNVINNFLVFTISELELMDTNAEFKIYTWLKEYSTSMFGIDADARVNDEELERNMVTTVKIKDLIELLTKDSTLNMNTHFPDGQIGQTSDRTGMFHSFGQEYFMVAHIQKIDNRYILEGPIKLGNGSKKAAAWIGFELID